MPMSLQLQRISKICPSTKSGNSKKSGTSKLSKLSFRKTNVNDADRDPPPVNGVFTLESDFARDLAEGVDRLWTEDVPPATNTTSESDLSSDRKILHNGKHPFVKRRGEAGPKENSPPREQPAPKETSTKRSQQKSRGNPSSRKNRSSGIRTKLVEEDPGSGRCVTNDVITDGLLVDEGSHDCLQVAITDVIFPVDGLSGPKTKSGLKTNWYCCATDLPPAHEPLCGIGREQAVVMPPNLAEC